MLRAEPDFDDVAPAESDVLSFNFRRLLPADGRIVSAAWSVSVLTTAAGAAVDETPQSRLVGDPFTASATPTITSQRIGPGCVPGNRYLVTAVALDEDDNEKVMFNFITCRNPG